MNTSPEEFDKGFVDVCMSRGLNIQDTDMLHKMALYAKAFDQPEFLQGFVGVVGPDRVKRMSLIEKAACLRKYFDNSVAS